MLARKYLAQIHIEKKNADVSDEEYRLILHEVAGVESSKNLAEKQVWRVVNAIRSKAAHKPSRSSGGWQQRQISKLRQYAITFCKLDETRMRETLFQYTGVMHEDSRELKQADFDQVMAGIEECLEAMIQSGKVKLPSGLDVNYWRNRLPGAKLSSRQIWEIKNLWEQICQYLDEDKRGEEYLNAILSRVCRMRVCYIGELPAWRAVKAIEALKLKLEQEQTKMKEEVPF